MFEEYVQPIAEFVRMHQVWAAPIVFALAFVESLAFVSLLVPAWGVLVLIGTMIQAGGLNFWPIWIAGSIGAALGDWLSYWIGRKLEHTVQHIWPLSKHPDLIPKGEAFIKKWGALGIFIGRFSGPLRASVPLVAGIFEMPFWRFQIANFSLGVRLGRSAAPARRRGRQGFQADLEITRRVELTLAAGCFHQVRLIQRDIRLLSAALGIRATRRGFDQRATGRALMTGY